MYIGMVYDYDDVAPVVVFGPFSNDDEAADAAIEFIELQVHEGKWSPDVLSEDSDIQVVVEPLFADVLAHRKWKEANRGNDRNV